MGAAETMATGAFGGQKPANRGEYRDRMQHVDRMRAEDAVPGAAAGSGSSRVNIQVSDMHDLNAYEPGVMNGHQASKP